MAYQQTYRYGEICTLTAIPDDCCIFSHWVDDRFPCIVYSEDESIDVPVSEDAHYSAVFKSKPVTVAVILNRPDLGYTTGSGTYDCGETVTVSASTNACNNIVWRNPLQCDTQTVEINGTTCQEMTRTRTCTFTAISDITIYADITPILNHICVRACPSEGGNVGIYQNPFNPFTDSFEGAPCTVSSPTISTCGDYYCGNPITLLETPNHGYLFTGWKSEPCNSTTCVVCNGANGVILSSEQRYETSVCSDSCFVACFSIRRLVRIVSNGCNGPTVIMYRLNNGAFQVYDTPFYVADGTLLKLSPQSNECCGLSSVYDGSTALPQPYEVTVNSDKTFTVNYTYDCHTVTVVATGCNELVEFKYNINNQGVYLPYSGPIVASDGDDVYIKTGSQSCCTFIDWYVYRNNQSPVESIVTPLAVSDVISDVTVEARFSYSNVTLTVLFNNFNGKSFIIATQGGMYYSSVECENGNGEYDFSFRKCETVTIFFSSNYSSSYDATDSDNCWISDKLVDANDVEYENYYHGIVCGEPYFTYAPSPGFHCVENKCFNAMVLTLYMDGNKTVEYSEGGNQHSQNQIYYFSEHPGVGEGSYSDFVCPFMNGCEMTGEIETVCSN